MAIRTSLGDMTGNFLQHRYPVPEDPNDKFPSVPLALLEALEARFPDKSPDIKTPDREVWAQVGNSQVVRFLREMHERNPLL